MNHVTSGDVRKVLLRALDIMEEFGWQKGVCGEGCCAVVAASRASHDVHANTATFEAATNMLRDAAVREFPERMADHRGIVGFNDHHKTTKDDVLKVYASAIAETERGSI